MIDIPDRLPSPSPPPVPVDRHALYAAFSRREAWTPEPDCGVICAADSLAFPGLRLMLASVLLSHDVAVTVCDLGMTTEQRAWLARQPVQVVKPELPEGHRFAPAHNRWALWIKPALFAQSPYDLTVWLDSDVIVRRDLGPLFAMARELGTAFFPDTFAKPDVLLNDPALYERFPVAAVYESVNSGVVAFRRGEPWVARAAELLDAVIAGDVPSEWIRGWDQGLFKLAWEEAAIPPIPDPSWNRPGWALSEMGRSLDVPELLARCAPGEITHFQSEGKPWRNWGDCSLSLRRADRLTVFVLGHEPFARPERPWLTPVNLTDHDPDQAWGECRFYDLPFADAVRTEYVGLTTFSWLRKYDAVGVLAPWEFGDLDLRRDRVWCAQRTDDRSHLPYPDWADHIEHFNPGAKVLIDELRRESGLTERGPACWSNNFVMHRDHFAELVAFYRRWMAYFRAKYPTCPYEAIVPAKSWGYLGEAIGVHWLASRAGLEFVEMRPASRPSVAQSKSRLAQVKRCPDRGCKSSCQNSDCRRLGRSVPIADCLRCVAGESLISMSIGV